MPDPPAGFLTRKLPDPIADTRVSGRVLARIEEMRVIAEKSARNE